MAQGKIIVTTSELETAAQKIEALADSYHENYSKLYELVNNLSEMSWQGKDNEMFTHQISQFKDDFENMEHIVRDYAGFLRRTAEGYRTTQGYVADNVGKKLQTNA